VSPVKRKNSIDRVGAVILLRGDGAALMQLRDEKPELRHAGLWVPPGGHADPEEEIEACAKREFFEETNYKCGNLNFLSQTKDLVHGWPEYILTVYWGLYDSVQDFACNEGQDLRFIGRDEIYKYPIPAYLLSMWDSAIQQANLEV
jgi:8-oxo-dGTP pyrophosphatase MutT (NUDIX family)